MVKRAYDSIIPEEADILLADFAAAELKQISLLEDLADR